MNKKILFGSILAAALILLASLSSVVGFQTEKSNTEKKNVSPLFTIRKNRSLNKEDTKDITSNYIGKGKTMNLFLSKESSLQNWVNKALKIIEAKPQILNSIIDKIYKSPEVVKILKDNNINMNDLKHQINLITNNPSLLQEKIDEAALNLPIKEYPLPAGLSTSNPIGCVIAAVVLAPVILIIGIVIATVTIVTCLNVGGCLETLMQNLMDSISQGLTPADYGDYI